MRYLVPIFAAVALATACSNNDLVSPNRISGRFDLRTLNGATLPAAINSRIAVNAEQLTLNDDGTYSDIASYSDGTSFTEVGYYSVNNNAISFQDQTDGINYSGSISGDVLTEINGSFTSVYQRE
ncbi:MAG TPA: hypothetical protein VGM82_00380 [Gemmatimonadaceae bacterium]|jgi:hypothetical protein